MDPIHDYHIKTNHRNLFQTWKEFTGKFKRYDTDRVIALPETWERISPETINIENLSYILKFSSGIIKILYRSREMIL